MISDGHSKEEAGRKIPLVAEENSNFSTKANVRQQRSPLAMFMPEKRRPTTKPDCRLWTKNRYWRSISKGIKQT